MRYTIYKVINKINGKIYIGKHSTKNINDQYLGSGKLIRAAIKKYGKDSFEKIILFDFDTELEMDQKEREIISEEFVNRLDTYNVGIGGEGGPHFKGHTHSDESKRKIAAKSRRSRTEVERKNMSLLMKAHPERHITRHVKGKIWITNNEVSKMIFPHEIIPEGYRKGRKMNFSREQLQKMSDLRKGKKFSETHKYNMSVSRKGKKRVHRQ